VPENPQIAGDGKAEVVKLCGWRKAGQERCIKPRRKGQRYCDDHHAEYMHEWRKRQAREFKWLKEMAAR